MATKRTYPLSPDLGEHLWHEEQGIFHGYINGVYYRMVCTQAELEEIRQHEMKERGTILDTDELWWAIFTVYYLDPSDSWFGEFEPGSPFEEDLDFEARRRIIAFNMVLDPTMTTWYGLSKQYDLLMDIRRQDERQKELKRRLQAFGTNPKAEQQPETRRTRTIALELGLNPYTATWDMIDQMQMAFHKVVLPSALVSRAQGQCDKTSTGFEDLIQKALTFYLDQQELEAGEG